MSSALALLDSLSLPGTVARASAVAEARPVLPLGLEDVDAALPEGGLPSATVVEVQAPRGLARSTSFALRACAAAQARARHRASVETSGAWCAWIDPSGTLFAPGVVQSEVDLSRLLVVRPTPDALARIAVRLAQSAVFAVVVVDLVNLPGAHEAGAGVDVDLQRWVTVVRRLALAVEGSDTTILLLTDRNAKRSLPLPVGLRIDLERRQGHVALGVSKERFGRLRAPRPVRGLSTARRSHAA